MAADHDLAAQYTLLNLAMGVNNKQLLDIVQNLVEVNDVVKDSVWQEANQLTSHVIQRAAALPTGSLRSINDGVDAEVVQTEDVVEYLSLIESRSEIDEYLIDLAPEPKKFRYQRDMLHMEGMTQKLAYYMFYGNHASDPKQFDGLAVRMNDTDQAVCPNVWNNGGSSTLTSLYIVQWGLDGVYMVYPRNNKTLGIQKNDLGKLLLAGANSKNLLKYVTQFKWNGGLVVNDLKSIQRVANISVGSTYNLDVDLVLKAINRLPRGGRGAVIYVNANLQDQLDIEAKNRPNVFHTATDPFGRQITSIRGIPIHRCDQISSNETAVST